VPTKINTTLKFKTISTTSNSSFAIDENNVVWCWGANDNGVTGTCQAVQNTPVKLNNPSNIKLVSLAGGAPSTMGGITSSGDLYSWGNGTKGGLGNGVDSTNNPTMTKITFSNPILSVEFGKNGGLILDRNRDVWGFGTNEYGELGLSDLSIKNRVPTKISSLSNIMGIVADINIRMALSTNGVAYSWGDTTNNRTGFSANSGVKYTPTVISNSAMSIASSKTHSAILSTSGNAIIFGLNQYGQNGSHNNNATNSNYTFNPGFYIENIYLLDSTTLMYSNYDLYSIGAGWYGVMGNNNNTTNQYNDTKKWILNSLNNIPTITLKIIKNLKEEELSKIL
jgi:alpha-tubulin suppressor-like RCC1 family protein